MRTRRYFGWGSVTVPTASCDQGLVIHYDGGKRMLTRQAHSACVLYWKGVRLQHIGQGWSDIGYSFGVCPHGEVFEGRGWRKVQAAQPGGNSSYTSVTLMLGLGEHPTDVQIDSVRQLRKDLMERGMRSVVKGHRDFIATSCPGPILYRMVQDGTFRKAPDSNAPDSLNKLPATNAGGSLHDMGADMLGLKHGDKGDAVEALQLALMYAGFGKELGKSGPGKDGIDGHFGNATAKALLAARRSQGSGVKNAKKVTPWAYTQLMNALIDARISAKMK